MYQDHVLSQTDSTQIITETSWHVCSARDNDKMPVTTKSLSNCWLRSQAASSWETVRTRAQDSVLFVRLTQPCISKRLRTRSEHDTVSSAAVLPCIRHFRTALNYTSYMRLKCLSATNSKLPRRVLNYSIRIKSMAMASALCWTKTPVYYKIAFTLLAAFASCQQLRDRVSSTSSRKRTHCAINAPLQKKARHKK